jgi:hypothetical protein
MKRTGPRTWNGTTAPTSILGVGRLQVWVITNFIPANIETVGGVLPVAPDLIPSSLAVLSHPMKTDEAVVVDYGADHDAAELTERLAARCAQQGAGSG